MLNGGGVFEDVLVVCECEDEKSNLDEQEIEKQKYPNNEMNAKRFLSRYKLFDIFDENYHDDNES